MWQAVNGRNIAPTRNDALSHLNTQTIQNVYCKYKIPISALPDGYADVYTNPTVDKDIIFLTTQTQYDNSGNPSSVYGGEIIAIQRQTGCILWKSQISTYSGIIGDFTRAAPTIWKDYLFFATGVSRPQSITPYEATLINLYTGMPVVPLRQRQSLICVNKYNGQLVWKTPLGKKAETINDEDNWLYVTQSPTVVELALDANTQCSKTPIVIVGSSSGQSFQPWFYTNTKQLYTGLTLGDEFSFQMTDQGKIFLINAFTGIILKTISTGPTVLKKGDTIPTDAAIPNQIDSENRSYIDIRHIVTPNDIKSCGVLNPVQAPYSFPSTITYVLEILDVSNSRIPQPLNGIEVVDSSNIIVRLQGGALLSKFPTLQNVVVKVDALFLKGTNKVEIRGKTYLTNDRTTGLAGGTYLRPVRIGKRVYVGDTITSSEDAYQLNYFGATVWGNAIAIAPDKKSMFATSGQPHQFVYNEAINLNTGVPTFLDSQLELQLLTEKYQNGTKTFEELQQGYQTYNDDILKRQYFPRSQRLQQFNFCSILQISLELETFGQVIWTYHSSFYDFWQYGFTGSIRSKDAPYRFSNGQDYYERPRGCDGDFGQGVYITRVGDQDIMATCSKGGFLVIFDITPGQDQPTLLLRQQIGESVVNGASNYGSTIANDIFITIVTQGYYPSDQNLGLPSPINFPPQISWYTSPDVFYETRQSFVQAFSLSSLQPLWNAEVIPNDTSPYGCSLAQVSSTKYLVFIPAANGIVYIRDVFTGELVQTLNLDNVSGQSSPAIVGNEIYLALGRSGVGPFFNPGTSANYGPAKYLHTFSIC